jgi:hypothetical protein
MGFPFPGCESKSLIENNRSILIENNRRLLYQLREK